MRKPVLLSEPLCLRVGNGDKNLVATRDDYLLYAEVFAIDREDRPIDSMLISATRGAGQMLAKSVCKERQFFVVTAEHGIGCNRQPIVQH